MLYFNNNNKRKYDVSRERFSTVRENDLGGTQLCLKKIFYLYKNK